LQGLKSKLDFSCSEIGNIFFEKKTSRLIQSNLIGCKAKSKIQLIHIQIFFTSSVKITFFQFYFIFKYFNYYN